MTALNVFLFGMPLLLIAGGAVTLVFARRAAADIRSHENPRTGMVTRTGPGGGQIFSPNVEKILSESRPRAKAS